LNFIARSELRVFFYLMKAVLQELFLEVFKEIPDYRVAAPGRIEFIGNHTDYNGGMVLGAAVDYRVFCAIRPREDKVIRLWSEEYPEVMEFSLRNLENTAFHGWSAYPLGVVCACMKKGYSLDRGFDAVFKSSLPQGAGMSSSAALELSTVMALNMTFSLGIDLESMVRISRYAENHFVGVPCGILDQGVSGFGEKDKLVCIDCKKEVFSTVALPQGLEFLVFNTGVKHALVDSFYSDRHRECMEALQAIRTCEPGIECLADLSPNHLRSFEKQMPPLSFQRACHVVEENDRVKQMIALLKSSKPSPEEIGQLLYQSHSSSSRLFENSCPELDFLVEGTHGLEGVYGSRLTGGGFGGAVMVLAKEGISGEVFEPLMEKYARQFNHRPGTLVCKASQGVGVLVD